MIIFKTVYSMYRGLIENISNLLQRTTEDNQERKTEDNQNRELENGS